MPARLLQRKGKVRGRNQLHRELRVFVVKLQREIEAAKKRFKLLERAEVVSCYEAGRDGFWLHRYLVESGIVNS